MKYPRKRTFGFSLVEVSLALGVAGFCLVSIMGLLPVGLTSNQNSLEQTGASSVAAQIFGDLRATPAGANALSPRYQLKVPSATTTTNVSQTPTIKYASADGTLTDALVNMNDSQGRPPSKYRISISFTTPPLPSGPSSSAVPAPQATMVDIIATWPAAAANALGSFETMSALNRG
jgi:Tfp pilus assembly protein PilV